MTVREKTADVDVWLSNPLRYTIDLDNPTAVADLRRRVHQEEVDDADVVSLREMIKEFT